MILASLTRRFAPSSPKGRGQTIDERQRGRLKALVHLGKERGYVTYAELKSSLGEDGLDPKLIEDVASMLNDRGIHVYDDDAPETG